MSPHGLIWGLPPALPPDLTRDLTEELPFLVGNKPYRSYYLGTDHISENIRRHYRTFPFDLPSAASCLDAPLTVGEVPNDQRLDWSRLLSTGAMEVCLARVLNRFDCAEPAMEWVAAQGLLLGDHYRSDIASEGDSYTFYWGPNSQNGPHPWWNALPQDERDVWVSLSVKVDTCAISQDCGQIANPDYAPPFFGATVQANSKYQK